MGGSGDAQRPGFKWALKCLCSQHRAHSKVRFPKRTTFVEYVCKPCTQCTHNPVLLIFFLTRKKIISQNKADDSILPNSSWFTRKSYSSNGDIHIFSNVAKSRLNRSLLAKYLQNSVVQFLLWKILLVRGKFPWKRYAESFIVCVCSPM